MICLISSLACRYRLLLWPLCQEFLEVPCLLDEKVPYFVWNWLFTSCIVLLSFKCWKYWWKWVLDKPYSPHSWFCKSWLDTPSVFFPDGRYPMLLFFSRGKGSFTHSWSLYLPLSTFSLSLLYLSWDARNKCVHTVPVACKDFTQWQKDIFCLFFNSATHTISKNIWKMYVTFILYFQVEDLGPNMRVILMESLVPGTERGPLQFL